MKCSPATVGRTALSTTLAFALVACGGGGSTPPPTGGTPTPTPPVATCAISNQLAFADDVLNEWYLFPDLLDNTVNPANFTDVQSYLNARVAPARAQSRDQGFTFATSIAEENALISSGSSAGFGIRLFFTSVQLFVSEAFEAGNGFAAGIDRGTEILAIGTTSNNLVTVRSLLDSGGPQAVVDALGPSDPGVTRVIRFRQATGATIEATISKSDFDLDPISDRYGTQILDDGGKKVGYLNLRTFIVGTSDRQLVDAFQQFSDEGVTEFILDFRYNGGGLVRIAELMGDLMRGSNNGAVFSQTVFRESKSSENVTRRFQNTTQFFDPASGNFGPSVAIPSVAPTKIAFITTGSSASASELVINSMIPYVPADSIAIIGDNTSGKPVGQFGFDFDACDLRIRAVTFQTLNANDGGEYFNGLAGIVPNSCRANDVFSRPLGDPDEESVMVALNFLRGDQCNAIPSASSGVQTAQSVGGLQPLTPEQPSAAQYEIPGLF